MTGLTGGFDMQAECNGADLRVNEQIGSGGKTFASVSARA